MSRAVWASGGAGEICAEGSCEGGPESRPGESRDTWELVSKFW